MTAIPHSLWQSQNLLVELTTPMTQMIHPDPRPPLYLVSFDRHKPTPRNQILRARISTRDFIRVQCDSELSSRLSRA